MQNGQEAGDRVRALLAELYVHGTTGPDWHDASRRAIPHVMLSDCRSLVANLNTEVPMTRSLRHNRSTLDLGVAVQVLGNVSCPAGTYYLVPQQTQHLMLSVRLTPVKLNGPFLQRSFRSIPLRASSGTLFASFKVETVAPLMLDCSLDTRYKTSGRAWRLARYPTQATNNTSQLLLFTFGNRICGIPVLGDFHISGLPGVIFYIQEKSCPDASNCWPQTLNRPSSFLPTWPASSRSDNSFPLSGTAAWKSSYFFHSFWRLPSM